MSDPTNQFLSTGSFGIYVHIPFCQRKCPYCDFNSYATSASDLRTKESRYVDAIIDELKSQSANLNVSGRGCQSIFFGGGTPSLFSALSLERIIKQVQLTFNVDQHVEITMEVNPRSIVEDLSQNKLSQFYSAGINRISIGAQSFNAEKLKFLGRWHSPDDTIQTFNIARAAGFKNINLDLMFGIKGETFLQWKSDLEHAIALVPEHVSVYMLTMEPGTDFGKRSKKGEVFIVGEDDFFEFYNLTQAKLRNENYLQYEVSNFSLQNKECRHNLIYWTGGEYLGLGAGAHGFIKSSVESGLRWSNTPSPENYVKRVIDLGEAVQIMDPVGCKELIIEYISFRLRLADGIYFGDKHDFRALAISDLVRGGSLDSLSQNGLIKIENERIRVPFNKFNLVDGIAAEICGLI